MIKASTGLPAKCNWNLTDKGTQSEGLFAFLSHCRGCGVPQHQKSLQWKGCKYTQRNKVTFKATEWSCRIQVSCFLDWGSFYLSRHLHTSQTEEGVKTDKAIDLVHQACDTEIIDNVLNTLVNSGIMPGKKKSF